MSKYYVEQELLYYDCRVVEAPNKDAAARVARKEFAQLLQEASIEADDIRTEYIRPATKGQEY